MTAATRLRALIAATLLALIPCAAAAARPSRSAEEAWATEVRRRGLDPAALANPVAVSEAMREAARAIAGAGTQADQLVRLQRYLFDKTAFPFRYDDRATLTAAEAFAERRGNCVAFTNLFIALGRSLGVPLSAGLLYLAESEVDEGLVVVNNHLVAVHRRQGTLTLYDFAVSGKRSPGRFEVIDDLWLTAVYLNNLGVDALRAGDFDLAATRLEAAIRLAPEFIAPYANLGVVRRQLGDHDGAFEVYREVLAVDPRSPTVLANLARLYQDLGREEEARQALAAADLGGAPAHVLIARGNLELAQGNLKEALHLYKRARRLVPDVPEPWLAIGRLELQRGRPAAARRALERALALAPDDPAAQRLGAALAEVETER